MNIELSPEQKAAATALLDGIDKKPVQTMGGYAGTGKTVTLAWLAQKLTDFNVVAFTGKAASMMRRKGVERAQTIHSAIYDYDLDSNKFYLKSYPNCSGWLIDEASMVGTTLFRDLQQFGLPIIAIGDHGQLPPVGDDMGLMHNPQIRLEKIHRNAGPIAIFAEHLRKGGSAIGYHDKAGAVKIVPPGQRVAPETIKTQDQIICAYNRDRVKMNMRTIEILGRKCEPDAGHRVMCLRNNRDYGVFNGQQGVIKKLESDTEIIFQPDYGREVLVPFDPAAWNSEKTPEFNRFNRVVPFDFAYCITAHKSQGDEWQKVMVVEQKCKMWEHARWAYTAASRAKEGVLWLAAA